MKPMVLFGTKSETLDKLSASNGQYIIPTFVFFTVEDWRNRRSELLANIADLFGDKAVAVRSSCKAEDTINNSMAGAFTSLLDICANDATSVEEAVNDVIASYDTDPLNQVLVQEQITNTQLSGVATTYSLDHGSPYIVIDYDDTSGRTDSITGGKGVHKTVMLYRGIGEAHIRSFRIRAILRLVRSVESYFGKTPLDIEFGIGSDDTPYLFQVRPLTVSGNWYHGVAQHVDLRLPVLVDYINEISRPKPGIFGQRTILTNMSDWNPAEMIGTMPRPLASSLYRNVITRSVWREAREDMGYKPMPLHELMIIIDSRPFIDVRASLNSFLPEGLSADLSERLVNAEIERLSDKPGVHDKIEFEVAPTILDFSSREKITSWYGNNLSKDEIDELISALQKLTNKAVNLSEDSSMAHAEKLIAHLKSQQDQRSYSEAHQGNILLFEVDHLLEQCRKYGTLPFSILARHGFIGETILRSALSRGAISEQRFDAFILSIATVASNMAAYIVDVSKGRLSLDDFFKEYGHLRAGTYDITSFRYDARPELFQNTKKIDPHLHQKVFKLTEEETINIDALLQETGITSVDAEGLFEYIRCAVVGREYGKYVFSRNLSDALETLAKWGAENGLTREDISFLEIDDLLNNLHRAPEITTEDELAKLVSTRKKSREKESSTKFSYFIDNADDVYVITLHRSMINYIGNEKIESQVQVLTANCDIEMNLEGKIICIENADPGFDWIFLKGIGGLVTKYGGLNSHMSIRCAEFGLPAAIGCGEAMFVSISAAELIELDCSAKSIRFIK